MGMRIFRTLILIGGIGVLLPSPPDDGAGPRAETTPVASYIVSATSTVADMAGFCGRQPHVCETAGAMTRAFEAKAKYGAILLYDWASKSNDAANGLPLGRQASAADPMATGTLGAAAGPSTLRVEDLIPEWRGPVARKG